MIAFNDFVFYSSIHFIELYYATELIFTLSLILSSFNPVILSSSHLLFLSSTLSFSLSTINTQDATYQACT